MTYNIKEHTNNKNMYIAYTAVFCSFYSLSMLQPMLFDKFPAAKGKDVIFLVNCIIAAYPFAQFFFLPILGYFSDCIGKRKILILSALANAILYAMHFVAFKMESLSLLLLLRILCGMIDVNMLAGRSIIAEHNVTEKRALYFGILNSCMHLGYALGPLSISWLLIKQSTASNYIFLLIASLYLLVAITLKTVYSDSAIRSKPSLSLFKDSMLDLLHDRSIKHVLIISVLSTIPLDIVYLMVPMTLLYIKNLSILHISIAISLLSISNIFANVVLNAMITKRVTPIPLLKHLHWCLMISTGLFLLTNNVYIIWLLSIVSGGCMGLISSYTSVFVSQAIPEGISKKFGMLLSFRLLFSSIFAMLGASLINIGYNPLSLATLFSGIFLYNLLRRAHGHKKLSTSSIVLDGR